MIRELRARSTGAVLVGAVVLGSACASDVGNAPNRASGAPAAPIAPRTLLHLAGDGELTVVDPNAATSRVVRLPQLSSGDPPYRILRVGEKLAVYSWNAVYTLDRDLSSPPRRLAKAWFFIPSSDPRRLWLGILDATSPERARGLAGVREVTGEGAVTVADLPPPGGRWPVAAVDGGLVFERRAGFGLDIWDIDSRAVVRVLRGTAPAPGRGTRLPWCSPDYGTLHVTDVRSGDEIAVVPPAGFAVFDCWSARFSPDGSRLAVPVAVAEGYEAKRALALVDVERGVARAVERSLVPPGYVFVAWAPTGDAVFMSGGDRHEPRTLVAYRLGDDAARRLPVRVGDFYGLAAS